MENSESSHFSHSNSGHPITAQVATADGFPMVASYDPLNGQIDYFFRRRSTENFLRAVNAVL